MSRRLEALQWFGLFGGGLAWTAQLVVGFGLAQAACSPAGERLGIGATIPQYALTAAAALITILAGAAAGIVALGTPGETSDDPPPAGRHRFFALAALAGNLLFLALVINTGLVAAQEFPCHQS